MIVYKRELTIDDVCGLDKDEELIFYMSDDVAIVVIESNGRYVVRKKGIYENELIEEAILKEADEVMEFVQNLSAKL